MNKTVSLIDAEMDSQRIVRFYLKSSREFRFSSHYRSAEDALLDVPRSPPDLILINVRLPGICGIECTHTLKRLLPKLPVVVMEGDVELTNFIRAFQAGAAGYFILPGTAESFQESMSDTLAGWKPFPKEIQKLLVERLTRTRVLPGIHETLTPTEHSVMAYLVLDLSDKEIATLTGKATATIHTITQHIFKKMGVHSRREAVRVYLGFKQNTALATHP